MYNFIAMSLINLAPREHLNANRKTAKAFNTLEALRNDLADRQIPKQVEDVINREIEKVNQAGDDQVRKQMTKSRNVILSTIQKELKLVPRNHYMVQWMSLGMASIGIPIGLMFGLALDNFAFFAIGLPIGMSIGIAIGSGLDKKAASEGRQLSIDL